MVAAGPTFKLLRTNALDDMTLASPALVGDRLLLRTEKTPFAIRGKS